MNTQQELQIALEKLKESIENLEDDRLRQLEAYEFLAEYLFGEDGSLRKENTKGLKSLLDPEVTGNLVNLLNNMAVTAKTKAEISKVLFESLLVFQDLGDSGLIDDDKQMIDRKNALKLLSKEE